MGYTDISKNRRTVASQAAFEIAEKNKREVVRFKIGTVYQRGRSKWVCVKRKHKDIGDVIWLAELNHHRQNLKNFWNDDIADSEHEYVEYDEEYFCGEDWVSIDAIRTFDGIEYASTLEDVEEMEAWSNPQQDANGRYDFDDIEEIDKHKFEFRADKSCGEEPVAPPEKQPKRNSKKTRKSKKGNPIIGLILIAFFIILIRACSGT